MTEHHLFTSESVTTGHPDKLCDQISDAILDAYLARDPASRVITEAAVSGGVVFLAVRANSDAAVDASEIAREVIADAGYRDGEFNCRDCTIMTSQYALPADRYPQILVSELAEDRLDSVVAGQPATVFGYACRETPTLMPLPITLAHALARALDDAIADGRLPQLNRDAKVQVGVEYADRVPLRIHSVALLTTQQRVESPSADELRRDLIDQVLPVLRGQPLAPDADTELHINPGGAAVGGGPVLHAGLTGRKLAIDTYGEYARHSGAALSGKDPLRIDRVGAYAARHAAKQVVWAGLAENCEVQISYTVGRAQPASLRVHTYGTGRVPEAELGRRLRQALDFRPAGIVRRFDLQRLALQRPGFFRSLAVFGHMGRVDLDAPWEQLDAGTLLS